MKLYISSNKSQETRDNDMEQISDIDQLIVKMQKAAHLLYQQSLRDRLCVEREYYGYPVMHILGKE